jgi:hypothetical protein
MGEYASTWIERRWRRVRRSARGFLYRAQGVQPGRLLTILGGTDLVEVPHYEFAVPRTCENLVIIAWGSTKTALLHHLSLDETHSRGPRQRRY